MHRPACAVLVLLAGVTAGASGPVDRLVAAVQRGDTAIARAVLKQGVDVDAPGENGATALHWAVQQDDERIVDLLLRSDANVNVADDLGTTPLALASLNGNAAVAEKLLARGANPNIASVSGASPLLIAARVGSADCVRALLDHGADSRAREKSRGQTALMWAVANQHPDAVRLLIERGADIHARSATYRQRVSFGPERPTGDPRAFGWITKGGSTPLLFAARVGDVDSAAHLLKAGADVNDTLPDGQSALVLAIRSGQRRLAALLIERGADPNAARAGFAPLHVAVLTGASNLVESLLARGADPNAPLTNGTPIRRNDGDLELPISLLGATPFMLAARYADTKTMRILSAKGADPRRGLSDGTTPLMAAAGLGWSDSSGIDRRGLEYEHAALTADGQKLDAVKEREEAETLEAVTFLLETGVPVDAAAPDGNTALFGAVSHRFDSVVQLLADKGASVNRTNGRGQTPLSLVTATRLATRLRQRNDSTVELLMKLGAKP